MEIAGRRHGPRAAALHGVGGVVHSEREHEHRFDALRHSI